MLTPRMLGFLKHRLMANAPRQAGSHEYLAGVNDTIAAVRRLLDVSDSDTVTLTGLPDEPGQTRLAAEYLKLETSSLLWLIDSTLRRPSAAPPEQGGLSSASLLEARDHLVQARAALGRTEVHPG